MFIYPLTLIEGDKGLNPIKYDSQTRMTRGIELLERGVKITEAARW